jgi:hypothetical protein
MRRFLLICGAVGLVACSKPADQPAADATATPAMLMMSDLAGKWHVKAMPENSDSVITEYDVMVDSASATVMLPNRDPMMVQVMVSGDSVIMDSGPFESVLRKGVQVTTHGVSRLQGGELVGMTTAHYATTNADSVVTLRTQGTRTP